MLHKHENQKTAPCNSWCNFFRVSDLIGKHKCLMRGVLCMHFTSYPIALSVDE